MIYADNAATTKLSAAALSAMLPYLSENYGNASAVYTFGQAAKAALENARARIAHCLCASPKEIIFTAGGSESDNQALRTGAFLGAAQGKRHIISTVIEHHAVLETLQALQKEGFRITLLDVGENGIVTPEQILAAHSPETALVSIMFANNEIGTIQPIAEIGALCRQNGILFHTDAVQAAGHLPINVQMQQIDLLSLSAHKFHGPKGIGVLYARRGIHPEKLIFGGGQERGFRAGTENIPAIVGMAAALEESLMQLEKSTEKLRRQQKRLMEGLSEIPDSVLNGDAERRLPSNVNYSFAGIEGELLLMLLDQKGICASSGSACTAGSLEPSHVLLALGRSRALARSALRLTLSEDTTDEEIETILQAVKETVAYLRAQSQKEAIPRVE